MGKSLPELRNLILQSEEFRHWGGAAAFSAKKNPLEDPRIDVDIDVPPDLLSRMIARVEQNFSYLGKTEPYWSVVTAEKYLMVNIEGNSEEFLLSGSSRQTS